MERDSEQIPTLWECPTVKDPIQNIELHPTPDKICDKMRYCPKTGNYFHTPESLALQPIAPVPDSIKTMMEAEEKRKAENDEKNKLINEQQKQIETLNARLEALMKLTEERFDKIMTLLPK